MLLERDLTGDLIDIEATQPPNHKPQTSIHLSPIPMSPLILTDLSFFLQLKCQETVKLPITPLLKLIRDRFKTVRRLALDASSAHLTAKQEVEYLRLMLTSTTAEVA